VCVCVCVCVCPCVRASARVRVRVCVHESSKHSYIHCTVYIPTESGQPQQYTDVVR